MSFERRPTIEFKALAPPLLAADYNTLSEQSKLQYKEALFKGTKDDVFSLSPISSKLSLAKLPKDLPVTSSTRNHYEDFKIPLKPPCTASPSTESEASSEYLDVNLADMLYQNLSSLEHCEKKDMVDMEDEEITQMWYAAHKDSQLPNPGVNNELPQNTAKAVVIPQQTGPSFYSRRSPSGVSSLPSLLESCSIALNYFA